MIAPRVLEDLQDAAKARLLGDEFLSDVTVLMEQYSSTTDAAGNVITEVEDISNRVLVALGTLNERAGKNGAVVVVMMPEVDAANPNVPGVDAEIILRTRVVVSPMFNNDVNGTKKSEGQIAWRIALAFHWWACGAEGFQNAFVMPERNPVKPVNDDLPPGANGYETEHRARFAISFGPDDKVRTPVHAIAGGECTLTCDTPGATIRYTLDGGAPSAGNAAALTYEAPFAVEPGQTLRAAASKAGAFESDTLSVILS